MRRQYRDCRRDRRNSRRGPTSNSFVMRRRRRPSVLHTPQTENPLSSPRRTGSCTRYSADRLLYLGEMEVEEAPLYGFANAGDIVLTLGRRSLISVRNAETLEKRFDILSLAPGTAVPTLMAATGDATSILVMADKLRLADVSISVRAQLATLPKAAGTKRANPVCVLGGRQSRRRSVGQQRDDRMAPTNRSEARVGGPEIHTGVASGVDPNAEWQDRAPRNRQWQVDRLGHNDRRGTVFQGRLCRCGSG